MTRPLDGSPSTANDAIEVPIPAIVRSLRDTTINALRGIAAALASIVGARVLSRLPVGSSEWMSALFSKDYMGPGRIPFSVLTYYRAYRALAHLAGVDVVQKVLKSATFLGTRSLDCYSILSPLVLALPAVWGWDRRSLVGILLAGVIMVLCWRGLGSAQVPGCRSWGRRGAEWRPSKC